MEMEVRHQLGAWTIVQRAALVHLDPTAFRVYVALGTFANGSGECFPSRSTLAELCRCSVDTVDRALRSLVSDEWITKTRRKGDHGNASNLYTINVNVEQATLFTPSRTHAATPSRTHAATLAAPVRPEEDQGTGPKNLHPAAPAERARDEVWDALSAVFGEPVTRGERALRGKVLRSLKEAGATGADVKHRCDAWDEHWRPDGKGSSPTLTVTALEKHWTALGQTAGPPRRLLTQAEIDAIRAEGERKQAEQVEMIREHQRRSA